MPTGQTFIKNMDSFINSSFQNGASLEDILQSSQTFWPSALNPDSYYGRCDGFDINDCQNSIIGFTIETSPWGDEICAIVNSSATKPSSFTDAIALYVSSPPSQSGIRNVRSGAVYISNDLKVYDLFNHTLIGQGSKLWISRRDGGSQVGSNCAATKFNT